MAGLEDSSIHLIILLGSGSLSRTQERVVVAESLETVFSLDLPGLNTQLLGGVELLDAGPDEIPAPDPVLPPVLVETVLGAVPSHPAPGAPVGPERGAVTAVTDLGVGQHRHQSASLLEEELLVEILSCGVAGLVTPTDDDVPGGVRHVQDTGGVRHSGHLVLVSPQVTHVGRDQLGLLPSDILATANTVSSRGQRDTTGPPVIRSPS